MPPILDFLYPIVLTLSWGLIGQIPTRKLKARKQIPCLVAASLTCTSMYCFFYVILVVYSSRLNESATYAISIILNILDGGKIHIILTHIAVVMFFEIAVIIRLQAL
jgi:CHASE2 domain-containing sensor protein